MGFHLKISGVTFDDRQKFISKLNDNEELKLVREPENEHDKDAIAVYNQKDEKLGYIPASFNGKLSYQIDNGTFFKVTVSQVTGGGIGMNFGLNIFIEEI